MERKLSSIIKKLRKSYVYALSSEELVQYFQHRLEQLLQKKKTLVYDELEYLMGETGPGNLRIDPQLLMRLIENGGKEFTYFMYKNLPEMQEILNKKKIFESYVCSNLNSQDTQKLIAKLITPYLKNLRIVNNNPLTIEALFEATPIICLIKNGTWIFPDEELFLFLKKAKEEKKFPIVIGKKISGILFPVFKNLSILGLNTYKTYLPIIGADRLKEADSVIDRFFDVRYNNQFDFLSENNSEDPIEEHLEGEAIRGFFQKILPNNIVHYSKNFLSSKIEIKDNFLETVSQFRKNKVNKSIMESFQRRQTLIEELTKNHQHTDG